MGMYYSYVGQCENCLEREVTVYDTSNSSICIDCLENEEYSDNEENIT